MLSPAQERLPERHHHPVGLASGFQRRAIMRQRPRSSRFHGDDGAVHVRSHGHRDADLRETFVLPLSPQAQRRENEIHTAALPAGLADRHPTDGGAAVHQGIHPHHDLRCPFRPGGCRHIRPQSGGQDLARGRQRCRNKVSLSQLCQVTALGLHSGV